MVTNKYSISQYTYLELEDAAFAQAFRLTEDQMFDLFGGIRSYTQFRLDRQTSRGASITSQTGETIKYDVPMLPSSTEAAMARMPQLPGLKEQEWAATILQEQRVKVQGIVDALRASKAIQADSDRIAKDRQTLREMDLAKYRREGANLFGWDEKSQSAEDYAQNKIYGRVY